jgi:hypothetical protein
MKNIVNDSVGSLELITFRTTRYEHPYKNPISALITGLSSGHMAMRLTFTNTEIFNKYINGNSRIPHRSIIEPETNKEYYEVYVSFWPEGNGVPWHERSSLRAYTFDCQQSGMYSPIEYDPDFEGYLNPLTRNIMGFKLTLPPTIVLHTTRLGMAYGDKLVLAPERKIELNPNLIVMQAAENYTIKYREWREALVYEQNQINELGENHASIAAIKHLTIRANKRLIASKLKLKRTMFPNVNMNDDEFFSKLEPYITFGYPERDVITLPMIHHGASAGLELEPMLEYIQHIANNPEDHPYNVFDKNCAHKALEILWHGGQNTNFESLKHEFTMPWYVRCLGVTITPILAMQHAERLQHIFARLNSTDSAQITDEYEDEDEDEAIESTALITTSRFKNNSSSPRNSVLTFYKARSSDEDELPTTRIGICAKLLEDFSQFIR